MVCGKGNDGWCCAELRTCTHIYIQTCAKIRFTYGKHYNNVGRGNITFDNFVQVCATIRSLTMAFQRFDTDGDGVIQIAYEQVCIMGIQAKCSFPTHSIYDSSFSV